MQPGPQGYEPKSTIRGRTPFHGELQHKEMTSDAGSPRQSASMDASQSMGQLNCMIENTRHVVDRLVMEEQAHGRQAEQGSEVEASEMKQQGLA
eukprot:7372870-Prorocentrum_lima.AAC.1